MDELLSGASTAAPKIVELGGRRCCPRSLGGCMGASWGLFGAFGELVCLPEASCQALGSLLEASWELSGSILGHVEQYAKIAKNLGKTMVFH